jgi:hypothetical protein
MGRTHIAKQRKKITSFKEMQVQCTYVSRNKDFTIHETIKLLQDFKVRIYANILYQVFVHFVIINFILYTLMR